MQHRTSTLTLSQYIKMTKHTILRLPGLNEVYKKDIPYKPALASPKRPAKTKLKRTTYTKT